MPDRFDRRGALRLLTAIAAAPAFGGAASAAIVPPARARVIVDNDLAGDPDGLYQLAHHVLSPSVSIPLIVGTHLRAGDARTPPNESANVSAQKAHELLRIMKRDTYRVVAGAGAAIPDRQRWVKSGATDAIVKESLSDSELPLFYVAGGSLTDLALAWLTDRNIGRRLKLVWIGGNEYPDHAFAVPSQPAAEVNLMADIIAGQIIFNESDIEIWQIPRDQYRLMLFSLAEMDRLARHSATGRYLRDEIAKVIDRLAKQPQNAGRMIGESYPLGDSPVVTVTALQSTFQPAPSSSRYVTRPTPRIDAQGYYLDNPYGRPLRVFTSIDQRLTFDDMIAKIEALDGTDR